MSTQHDLNDREQRAVRAALRVLRARVGAWAPLAKVLGCKRGTLAKVVAGDAAVSATMAFRVARYVGTSVDTLFDGRWLPLGTCPHCGRAPEDFDAEEGHVIVRYARRT